MDAARLDFAEVREQLCGERIRGTDEPFGLAVQRIVRQLCEGIHPRSVHLQNRSSWLPHQWPHAGLTLSQHQNARAARLGANSAEWRAEFQAVDEVELDPTPKAVQRNRPSSGPDGAGAALVSSVPPPDGFARWLASSVGSLASAPPRGLVRSRDSTHPRGPALMNPGGPSGNPIRWACQ